MNISITKRSKVQWVSKLAPQVLSMPLLVLNYSAATINKKSRMLSTISKEISSISLKSTLIRIEKVYVSKLLQSVHLKLYSNS